MLSIQMKESAARSVLCWLATIDETGQPNVSPKEIFGVARIINKQDAEYPSWAAQRDAMAGSRFKIHSVVVIQAASVEPILAPSYRLYPAETTEQSQVAAAMLTYGVRPAIGESKLSVETDPQQQPQVVVDRPSSR